MTHPKWIYSFGAENTEGHRDLKDLLGGKGANLAEMCNLGVPVPPGFTISTEVCTSFYQNGGRYPDGFLDQFDQKLAQLEKSIGKRLGDPNSPLLVSVRSGARISMPGMMDTVLNIGLSQESIEGMIASTKNERLVYDSYRRFVQMYGDVVLGMKYSDDRAADPFEEAIDALKAEVGVKQDTDLTAAQLLELVNRFKAIVKEQTGKDFPDDPREQLLTAVNAVFESWDNDRAVTYRRLNNIPDDIGTAVNVQAMVFGNQGDNSATGVAFTRNPANGETGLYGEFLPNAQGEDVVAGVRTPFQIAELAALHPKASAELTSIAARLEHHFTDMQDVEFTVEEGRLWMLQTRTGKRTGLAALRIAVDMVEEGLIDTNEALRRVEPSQLNQLLRPVFDEADAAKHKVIATGLNAGPGAATGRIVFHSGDAEQWAKRGEQVLLVRTETSPDDIVGMDAAQGILSSRGGMTSHAALVARQMGKVCVVGCSALQIDYATCQMTVGGQVFKEGDWLSLNGTTGEVLEGQIAARPSEVVRVLIDGDLSPEDSSLYQMYDRLMTWAKEVAQMSVHANADQPDQAQNAIAFGARGIGLCRTEHMFFGADRLPLVREMILEPDAEHRKKPLDLLQPIQQADFEALFRVMDGFPVTIRALDPPLHEFLPHEEAEFEEVAALLEIDVAAAHARAEALTESNPMLGHRGCRLGITEPEVTEMQARAIFRAAVIVKNEGVDVRPEIMIPLVSNLGELSTQRTLVERVAAEVFAEMGAKVDYKVGTMIELPRAALIAGKLAEIADFFSFGTNDLTQTTMGISRDDSASFIPMYVENGLLSADPFESLDTEGVGQLVDMGCTSGRKTNPDIVLGICGEHGGDPASIAFCQEAGLNYVSCSPFRVPIAWLACARAALENPRD